MTETVRNILKNKGSQVWSLAPDATVFEAIALMAEKSVGALVVLEGTRLAGIVSERDYARKVFLQGHSSKETLVREIMSAPVFTVPPEYGVEDCMRIMTESRVRHLPVVQDDRVVGMISIGDLVRSIISVQAETINQLSNYIGGRYPG